MNWKGCGRKHSWPDLRHYSGIFPDGRRKITKDISQESCNDSESNWAPPEYQSEAIPFEPICQVIRLFVLFVTFVSCRMLTGCGVMDG
jgi:hypothetical protein